MSRRRHMQRAMGYDVPKHKRQRGGKKVDNIPTIEVRIDPDKVRKDHVVNLVSGFDYTEGWLIRCTCGAEFLGTKEERTDVERLAFDHVYGNHDDEE